MQPNTNTDPQVEIAVPPWVDVHSPAGEVRGTRNIRGDMGLRSDMHSQRGDVHRPEEYTEELRDLMKRWNLRNNGFGEEGSYGATSVAHDHTDYSRTIRGGQVCVVFLEDRPVLTLGSRYRMVQTIIKNNSRIPPHL